MTGSGWTAIPVAQIANAPAIAAAVTTATTLAGRLSACPSGTAQRNSSSSAGGWSTATITAQSAITSPKARATSTDARAGSAVARHDATVVAAT